MYLHRANSGNFKEISKFGENSSVLSNYQNEYSFYQSVSKANNQKTFFSNEKVNSEPSVGCKSVKLNVAQSKSLNKCKFIIYYIKIGGNYVFLYKLWKSNSLSLF